MSGMIGPVAQDRMHRLADFCSAAQGHRRLALACGFGALYAFAFAPAFLFPLLWVSFPGLFWMLQGARSATSAFWTGWWFSFGHHIFGLYWISAALFTDIGTYWPFLPLALLGLPALMAAYAATACLIAHRLARRLALAPLAHLLILAALWSSGEWARGWLFSGFPWNLPGYVWSGSLVMAQTAALVGVHGLGHFAVLTALIPALAVRRAPGWRVATGGCALVLALMVAGGATRLASAPHMMTEGVMLRLVQPDIAQADKWAPGARLAILQKLVEQSQEPGWEHVTHLIWPEAAVPTALSLEDEPGLDTKAVRQLIGRAAPMDGLLLAGALRIATVPDAQGQPVLRYYNSLLALDAKGQTLGFFDKAHLVPFGEYIPLRAWLPLQAVASGGAEDDFTAGQGPRTLSLPGTPPFSPLICYEAIFPSGAVDRVAPRPAWILNLTNDAWYGLTAGPYQHFTATIMRGIEQGLPVVRAANNGISGVTDPYGRVIAATRLGDRATLDSPLPRPLSAITPYARFGDATLLMLIALTLAAAAWAQSARPWRHAFSSTSPPSA
jgi:apolipoprotein N-acyltransferase